MVVSTGEPSPYVTSGPLLMGPSTSQSWGHVSCALHMSCVTIGPCRFTTDLLVPATNRRTQVTFAYLQALLCGIRVLSWEWVHAHHAPPGVADEAFEVNVRHVDAASATALSASCALLFNTHQV